jgi:hypothetical protein
MADNRPPIEEDIRHDDLEFDPSIEPKEAKAWLNLLEESETAFEPWNLHCDRTDTRYANLARLADMERTKEFQLFWADCEVLKPAIYAKAPVVVVVPKFKDRRAVWQAASETMERCARVTFDLAQIDSLMLQVRDDLALTSRGVAWCRYESGKGRGYYKHEKVCIDFKHRRDFLHSVSRCWSEVTWVAGASYLTRAQARRRFYETSGDEYQDAEYKVDKDTQRIGGADNRERAKFWEIWDRDNERVVWVSNGCEHILDDADPHLELLNFFPCPRPAYGTCQRGSLVPVPDVMQYRDQLEEVNLLTGRIHALSDSLEVKGFYPAGGGELADAIQTAMKIHTPGSVLVPVSNWAAFGGSKEVIIWLPIDMIAQTVTALVELRKQIIQDIYEIIGLSDIMRGSTDARETLGAQELKSQYGGTRVRDKQHELERIARDIGYIACEIICDKFKDETIVEMAQMQLPTRKGQHDEIMRIQQQLAVVQQQLQQKLPQLQQMQQNNPEQAQQIQQGVQMQMAQGQERIRSISAKPNIEQVLKFLRDNRARTFTLDIETDSTILADENADKQRRTEFLTVLSTTLQPLMQMVAAEPQMAEFAGEVLKFSTAPYRAGRALEGAIDDMAEMAKQRGDQGKGEDPTTATNRTAIQIETIKQQRQAERDKADVALKAQELQMTDRHKIMEIQSKQQIEMARIQQKQQDEAIKAQSANQKAMHDREAHQADLLGKQQDMQLNAQKAAMAQAAHQARQGDMAARQSERQAAQAFKQSQPPGGRPGL